MSVRGLRRRSTALARRRRAWHLMALVADVLLAHRRRMRPSRTSRARRRRCSPPTRSSTTPSTRSSPPAGDVEISTGQRRLLADEVRWDERTAKVFAKGNVVLIEPSGDALFGDEIELDDDFREGFATRRRHPAQGRFAHRRDPGDASRGQPDRARPRGLLALPTLRGRQGRPVVADQGADACIWDQDGPDGQLPRRAARDVRPADRLHALFPPSGTRGEASVRLSHADLRQHLRARRWSRRSPTTSCSTRVPT